MKKVTRAILPAPLLIANLAYRDALLSVQFFFLDFPIALHHKWGLAHRQCHSQCLLLFGWWHYLPTGEAGWCPWTPIFDLFFVGWCVTDYLGLLPGAQWIEIVEDCLTLVTLFVCCWDKDLSLWGSSLSVGLVKPFLVMWALCRCPLLASGVTSSLYTECIFLN